MFSDKRRGDIWWMSDTHRKPADTCLIRGDRPVIVVSSDSANQTGSTATVVPMTSSPARLARGDGFCDNVLLLGYGEPSMALPRQVHGIRGFDRGGHRQRYRPAMCQSPGYDNGGLLQHSQPCPGRH